jgi:uncharacterized membrane protein SpoIIM required for sporulation
MLAIAINNLFVLLIYCVAGVLIWFCTGSKLAALGPWAVFAIHLVQAGITLTAAAQWMGWLPCLALVIPHGWIELIGLALGCTAGTKLYRGHRPYMLAAIAAAIIVLGAYVETYITPFPFGGWIP